MGASDSVRGVARRGVASTAATGALLATRSAAGGKRMWASEVATELLLPCVRSLLDHEKDAVDARYWALRLAQNPKRDDDDADSGSKDCNEWNNGWIKWLLLLSSLLLLPVLSLAPFMVGSNSSELLEETGETGGDVVDDEFLEERETFDTLPAERAVGPDLFFRGGITP